jgi:UDP-galactopyranose mutase
MNKILIIGGGVAGSSLAYFMKQKNYSVIILDKNNIPGGMSRTCYYAGHPYEFGPHIWFWPGGQDNPINKIIVELSKNELYYIDRKLFSYVEKDRKAYRYPIHFSDIDIMPDRNVIYNQIKKNRDDNWRLIESSLPKLGQCMFEEYFVSAIGENLYLKFMGDYTHKMWDIPGNNLKTSMVWADRFRHAYKKKDKQKELRGYDPIKFEDHTLGKGIRFQVYPKKGWNSIWGKMVEGVRYVRDPIKGIKRDGNKRAFIETESTEKYYFADYKYVINTIDVDVLWGENRLPYTGRMMIPLLIPGLERAFSDGAESIHYSGTEFQTRVTEMKVITKHNSSDTLLLVEVPVNPCSGRFFPENTLQFAKENNLYAAKAYPQQSEEGYKIYNSFIARGKKIPNLLHCGRHAEFKYWGMPETVYSAYKLAGSL